MENNEEVMRVDEEGRWKTEAISKQFEERYTMFKGSQWIGIASEDEPNQISFMVNGKNGIMFIEVFYEIVGDRELNIKKFRSVSGDEEIEW